MQFWKRKRQKDALNGIEKSNILSPNIKNEELSPKVVTNKEIFREIFCNCSDIVFRSIKVHDLTKFLVIYVDGLINTEILDQVVLKPMLFDSLPQGSEKIDRAEQVIEEQLIAIGQTKIVSKVKDIVQNIVSGNVAIFVEGKSIALIADMKATVTRSIEEPSGEPVIRGPREGFTEALRTNTSLLRRKIKSSRLKMESLVIGDITQTDIVISYIEGIATDSVLKEVRERIQRIQVDSILESGYIEEFIEDAPFSPFPTVQYTERSDVVAANLLEGKVAIFTDGTPCVLIVPFTFWAGLQSTEDYFERSIYMSAIRWIRFILFNAALFLPSLYVAITTFHPQMMPTNLLLSFAVAREPSPFPTVVEAFLMEVIFEALREAGVRLPKPVGSAVSIVGALVIGQAAVQAGLVSAPTVIIVSATGIASFAIPRYNLGLAYRILRFPLLIVAGTFGLYGINMGTLVLILHLVSLRSFGIPYMSPMAPLVVNDIKDVLWRTHHWNMSFRPKLLTGQDSKRIPKGQKPSQKR